MRTAIVVGSGWGAHAARAFAEDERVELLCVVGRGSARTKELAQSLRVPAVGGLAAALRIFSPTIAAVATRRASHASMVRALVHHGSHVLCAHPVANSSAEARELAQLARGNRLVVMADYFLRETALFKRAKKVTLDSGHLLRAAVTCPARALSMGIDLALAFAGSVRRVSVHGDYPPRLAHRVGAKPAAFAPTLVLDHREGCVTTIVPVPHAEARRALQITLSTERARIDVAFPAGGMVLTRTGRRGESTREVIPPDHTLSPADTFGCPMRQLAGAFIDEVLDPRQDLSLSNEVAVRRVWEEIARQRASDA